jgi:TM2 domain-containing membrane protein YozV
MTGESETGESTPAGARRGGAGAGLIYCGLCGALNPSTSYYCAACGTTLVDAFHASEGLRVFDRPDPAARLIEILPAGAELEVVAEAAAPADWVRIRLPYGRLGYVRLEDAAAVSQSASPLAGRPPDINTNARGCVTTTAALWALALLVITGILGVVIVARARPQDAGLLAGLFCLTLGPLILLTIGAYVAARTREDQLAEEEDALRELARGKQSRAAPEADLFPHPLPRHSEGPRPTPVGEGESPSPGSTGRAPSGRRLG